MSSEKFIESQGNRVQYICNYEFKNCCSNNLKKILETEKPNNQK